MKVSKEAINITIRNLNGELVEIPEMGSLGLLALGYKGVAAWRNKRKQVFELNQATTIENGS